MTAPEDQNGLREALADKICDTIASNLDVRIPGRLRNHVRQALALLIAERDAAVADMKAAEAQNDALHVKLAALAPHGSCACSYDQPGDVCAHHSPALRAAEAEITRLKEGMEAALQPFARAADAYPISPVARRENRRQCEVIWSYGSEDNGNRREITVSDLRNAAAALATLSPKEQP